MYIFVKLLIVIRKHNIFLCTLVSIDRSLSLALNYYYYLKLKVYYGTRIDTLLIYASPMPLRLTISIVAEINKIIFI